MAEDHDKVSLRTSTTNSIMSFVVGRRRSWLDESLEFEPSVAKSHRLLQIVVLWDVMPYNLVDS
jgi:hypothetical protein